ncbi:hypothetical protein PSI9734_00077 [Pseudidiomarina piscicola]|uniref:Lipoprotein n=1 Tax=Pseudidiomarina piscicola TaxID=2614830 RepID=A0A6S6WK46_9GAMM|nr:hypothetical protein [Pseudidiomarina piscicola]CAB0149513.1 hypothetical protein PSI9734_00077 [Pseudidiomarina piscicola]VZT38959.1 hypothetical protein PSI9734_00077 [Pseudomonas aeruginosa]
MKHLVTAAMLALLSSGCVEAKPEQTLSEHVAQQLRERVDQRYDASLSYAAFELNTLTAELVVTDVGVKTRVAALDDGLNQLLWAEHLRLTGDWLSQQRNQLQLDSALISNAQLTIAYYGSGQSNLHTLIDNVQAQLPVHRASEEVLWQVDKVMLEDVVVNLFDQGRPLVSVKLARLELPPLHSQQTSQQWVDSVLGPLLEQLIQQVMRGDNETMTVDMPALMQFAWREMGAF